MKMKRILWALMVFFFLAGNVVRAEDLFISGGDGSSDLFAGGEPLLPEVGTVSSLSMPPSNDIDLFTAGTEENKPDLFQEGDREEKLFLSGNEESAAIFSVGSGRENADLFTAGDPMAEKEMIPVKEEIKEVGAGSIVDSGICGANLAWQLDSEGILIVSGTGEMEDFELLSIDDRFISSAPWGKYSEIIDTLIVDQGITNIGDQAFSYCTNLKNVALPEGLMDIGADAFGSCLSLTTVGIPRSVAQIGIGAFLDKDDTGTYSLLPNLTIHGYYGSVAHTYARDNNIPFVDTTPTRTLSTPEDLTATNIVSGIRLNWKEVPKARYYLICYSFNGKYYQVAKTKSLTYTDEKVTNGARITYYVQALGYRMSSVNVLSSKPSTGVRIIRLTAPKLVVSSPQKRTVNLTWLRNAKASGYHIKMATNRSFTNARSIGASGGTRQFSGLVSGKVYYFIVRSYRDYGGKRYFSPWSNWTGVRVK